MFFSEWFASWLIDFIIEALIIGISQTTGVIQVESK